MNRFTKKEGETYLVDKSCLEETFHGYQGLAIDELATFENMMEYLETQNKKLEEELEQLKKENKIKTLKFHQKLGEKMLNDRIKTLYEFCKVEK